ncbi:fumarylacetoacetate hydrolase family protein [Aliiglaciecola sp. 3_MG-2023]|uniref:fumarylacetoacetate hydrolase family protein n=1 Tax=Aliiglaciecola sp. 3_MG-2023 TaxID=3062644 RepID=UPI0026E25740|nr:fumarylacetoacetate hydrolase family protein [Aliiglaciecola sp. 3_MG-2023]MDO6695310.1 fumarylacetoacetate hydrolase family protein [Aliiglaciecola sp. 3_MG-2023]
MKLLRFGPKGQEAPGILDGNNEIRDLSSFLDDIDGTALQPDLLEKIRGLDLSSLPIVSSDVRIGACVNKVGKFICIGLNYADHAAESNMPIPTEPEVFSKFTSAICGPYDDIIKPRNSDKLDWEVELAIVIGKKASYVSESDAAEHIAGYCICNDVSERTFQLERGNQWDKGKGCDSFGPIGPYLVTSDEITDPHNLAMWLEVNGKRFQNGNTKTMIFKPAFIVSYLSQFCTLEPGDVISTGTPPGVGLGQNPPLYLNVGDKITLGIAGLGDQSQTVIESN